MRDLGLSLTMHVLIVAMCILMLVMHASVKTEIYALKAIKPIWVTVVHEDKMLPHPPTKEDPHGLIKKQPKIKHIQPKHTVHQLGQKTIQGKALTALEQKLYQQIHDHYQVSQQALSMQQSGTVEVSFLLLPSGYAQQIQLHRASIYPLLNQAALAAVASSQPFHLGKQHLSQPQSFQISVDFQGGS